MQNTIPALYPQGPAATHLVPHDPLLPHTTSSLPPTFLLAILCIVIGIPSYLIYQGAFKTTDESLENKIKKPDDSFTAAAGDKKKKTEQDVDDPAPPLDLQDLQGLGGLVGLAAVIVMAFALFPEELNTMLGGLVENTTSRGMDLFTSAPPVIPGPPPIPPDYQPADARFHPHQPLEDHYPDSDPSRMSDREYLAEQGILPSWAEDLPEQQWYDSKSPKEIMLTCRIKPWLCDEDGLPIVKHVKPRRRTVPRETQVVQQTVASETVVMDSVAVPGLGKPSASASPFLEQHMAVLRSQPILMLPYDEESVIDFTRLVLLLLFLSPIPLLYAYGEVLWNAGLVEDKAKREDKKLGLDQKAEQDVASNKKRIEISNAKARKYKDEMKELEAIDDLQHGWRDQFKERPWWAGSTWQMDDPEKLKLSERPWRKERRMGVVYDYEDDDPEKPRKKMVSARHLKLDFDAEMEEARAKRFEAENKRILSKYPDEEQAKEDHPYRGIHNVFKKSERSGEERAKSAEEDMKYRTDLDIAAETTKSKAREMARLREKGRKKSSRTGPALDPFGSSFEKMAEAEAKVKAESRWAVNQYKDVLGLPNGVTKIEPPLTQEQRQLRASEQQWEQEEAREEDSVRSFNGTLESVKNSFARRVPGMPSLKLGHWQKRLREKKEKTPQDKVYLEVIEQELKDRPPPAPAAMTIAQNTTQQGSAPASTTTIAASAPKPKGFFQKANALLDKVGKA